jgi:tRNA-2-methylthio-N6-dimethylallyladenosine synthase
LNKYWIETYGCQMNKAESEWLENELRQVSWSRASSAEGADLVILNTCSVRQTAENRIWGRLGFYKREKNKRPFKLALMGCMGERLKEELVNNAPHVDIVVGNFRKKNFIAAVSRGLDSDKPLLLTEGGEYVFGEFHSVSGVKAYVPIMHGCNNFCSYCIVPYVRGREVSRNPDSIMEEIFRLEEKGIREITLLGQNVNSYCYNGDSKEQGLPLNFSGLLERINNNLKERNSTVEWFRFLTSHPKDLSDELIELLSGNTLLCRHIHLPVQHGSNKILESMERGYTREQYLSLVQRIKNSITNVSLTTDILIGFPGEEEDDFKATLDLMEAVGFDNAFTYRYNPREGTKAYAMEDTVPSEVKQERLSSVIEFQSRIRKGLQTAKTGRVVKVLIEGISKRNKRELLARMESDEMVVFPGSEKQIGSFTRVELLSIKGSTFTGKEI